MWGELFPMKLYKETKWLRFYVVERKPKTVVIDVVNRSHQKLGQIRWYGAWRQYTYQPFPNPNITLNNTCLSDIVDVLTDLNNNH